MEVDQAVCDTIVSSSLLSPQCNCVYVCDTPLPLSMTQAPPMEPLNNPQSPPKDVEEMPQLPPEDVDETVPVQNALKSMVIAAVTEMDVEESVAPTADKPMNGQNEVNGIEIVLITEDTEMVVVDESVASNVQPSESIADGDDPMANGVNSMVDGDNPMAEAIVLPEPVESPQLIDSPEPIEQKCALTMPTPLFYLPTEIWKKIFGYVDLMDILYMVLVDKKHFLSPARAFYKENVGVETVTITPFKVQLGDTAYPLVRLIEMFYAFGASWKKIYVVQTAKMATAMKAAGQALTDVNRLELIDLRLTRKQMTIFAQFLPNVQTIKLDNVTAPSKHRFDIWFPQLRRVVVTIGENIYWLDLIVANKSHIRKLGFLNEQSKKVTPIDMDETMKNDIVDMTDLKSLTLPAKFIRIKDLMEIMQRSVSLKYIEINHVTEKECGECRLLLPKQWLLDSIELEKINEDRAGDGVRHKRLFDCMFIRDH